MTQAIQKKPPAYSQIAHNTSVEIILADGQKPLKITAETPRLYIRSVIPEDVDFFNPNFGEIQK